MLYSVRVRALSIAHYSNSIMVSLIIIYNLFKGNCAAYHPYTHDPHQQSLEDMGQRPGKRKKVRKKGTQKN